MTSPDNNRKENNKSSVDTGRRFETTEIDTKDAMIAEILKSIKRIEQRLDRNGCCCSR